MSLGLIDLGFYTNAVQTAENARAFVAEARAANPRVRMVLLPVRPNVRAETDAPFATQVTAFADLDEPRSPLLLASRALVTTSPSTRTTAPIRTRNGEHKIAEGFAEAMHQAWDLGEPYTAQPA